MKRQSVILLLLCGGAALFAGWFFGTATVPQEQQTVARGQLAFPGLTERLRDVVRINIGHQGNQTVIEKRSDGVWGVAAMHDYPVQEGKLRAMLTALTELRLVEPRTQDPTEYRQIGVDDPNDRNSTANLLQALDASGKVIVALIVGHRRVRNSADLPDEVYVRRPDETQSWLAEGSLQVDPDPQQWLDRNIMNIAQDRIASVSVDDKALQFSRTNGQFGLTQPAEHPKLEDYKVDDVARGLELLSFQKVLSNTDVAGQDAGHAVFTTNDGLAITVTVRHVGSDVWARFVASGSDKTNAEAARLNARLNGWSFQIGSWKEKSLVPTIDDLKATPPSASANTK
jgi:hypothetical protein